jgi:hypothetical protein
MEAMKKWIFSFALLLFTLPSSFNQMMHFHEYPLAVASFSADEDKFFDPRSVNASYLSIRAMELEGFEGENLVKLEEAFRVLEQVVNSEEFKNRIINFKNRHSERLFASNRKMTNEQIYKHFMDGREDLQPHTPGEMNFYLKLYHKRFSKVIGWTNGNINTIHINWKYFKNFQPNEVAANLAHEWCHKIGFGHTSAAEHDSVPYAVGNIVGELGQKYLKSIRPH